MEPLQVTKRTCMCVDLDPDFYYLIQSFAERCGFCAIHVGQASETVHLARQIHPAIICLESDQYSIRRATEVIDALRASPETSPIPIFLFSWLDEEEKLFQAGKGVYVKKPVMYVDFIDALAVVGIPREGQ